ncbi:MAG: cobalamin biosynthesis protein CobQ [Rhodobacteraceae bacterium]|nr:cobalamin biosynthesis protein CobQ [Paracoccaceae bacterium]
MNTPAHLVVGLAAFGRPGRTGLICAALAGSLIPDASLYLMAGWALFVENIPARVVFGELYFSDNWQAIFAVDNSLVLWGGLCAVGVALRRGWLIALSGSALLHLIADFALHHDDARRHFWPVSDWVFVSPFSYWDSAHHGGLIGGLEVALVLALSIWMLARFRSWAVRGLVAVLCAAELAPFVIWRLVF